jgi:prepilin-type N-terminal cleavage/methylation domain-containing protein/prepilin-type processing-associated H-X9-DG protein
VSSALGPAGKGELVKRRDAFTLIEMLVVIAVMALLAGLIMPNLARVRAKGWETQCANNLRQLHAATANFAGDRGRYPFGSSFIDAYDNYYKGWIHWRDGGDPNDIEDDIEDSYAYLGANAEENIRNGELWDYMNGQIKVYACPLHVHDNADVRRSYAMCWEICGSSGASWVNILARRENSRLGLFAEVNEARLGDAADGSFFTATNQVARRHNGHANVVYADGHLGQW